MKEKCIISTNQFVWMLFSIITSFTALQIPGLLISHAGRDSWMSVIGAWFIDLLLAMVYAYMGLRFPGQNMVQYSMTILGKYVGRIVGIMFPLFFLMTASLLMRSLSALLVNLFLPRTPMVVVLGLGYVLIAYGVSKGIEVIARTCEALGPIYLISMIILLFMGIPEVKLHRLKPLLVEGVYPFLTGIPFILSFIGICIIMGMYIPICNRPKNGFLAKFIAVSIGATTIAGSLCLAIGTFGSEQAGNMLNPSFQLARSVHIGTVIERVEILWLMISIGAGAMTCANLIWAFNLGIAQITGLSTYKPLIWPSVLIAFILSVTCFDSNIDVFNFTFYSYMFIALFVQSGLEMLLFISALISGKRGKKTQLLS
ncbi:MAG TPA: hypothetical protein DEP72_02380 [Clostridiales bacterium]|nr:MAG: hypothetical protein A2Y18_01315 [Clostridiales bacterium GWD2_32_19]HCC07003.1 hypothetical protein [Clostridiales bacterium]